MVVIALIHPDLGIGGAERFVCDAAMALQQQGHTVKIFTSHHDKQHCFAETIDGTLLVAVAGDWLPRHLFWKFAAFFAYVRMIYLAIYLVFFSGYSTDVVICDQISACIPILLMKRRSKVIFFCHFPDLLLTQRKSVLKKLYRVPLDWLEEKTTGMSDLVLVNSKFTAKIFHHTFRSLQGVSPQVLYPTINFAKLKEGPDNGTLITRFAPLSAKYIFLSINRYERKKDIGLALRALRAMRDKISLHTWAEVHIIIAGGYDERVLENVQHLQELKDLAKSLDLDDKVTFVCSFSDEQKVALLKSATALLYTPSNEHFGIVPLEAMHMRCPVIACDSGGPLETVVHGVTGFLSAPDADQYAQYMVKLVADGGHRKRLGDSAHLHVEKNFSFEAFSRNWDSTVKSVYGNPREEPRSIIILCVTILVLSAALIFVLLR